MNAGMGTDLFSAYSEPESINVNQYDFDQRVENVRYSPDIEPQTQPIQEPQQPTQQIQQQPPSKSMIYNQSELLQDINESALKEQMHVLKQEIETHKKQQQMQYRESYERRSLMMLYSIRKKR